MNGFTVLLIVLLSFMVFWFVRVWREEKRAEQLRKRLLMD